ncbi:thioredoxin family protein [Echinicola sp. 20G]|uniref:thioredoxin family protein n=1 Tax=Echinicola sp. 20G TaxID=2781961 RepID=UPI0019110385|nr:thioredoxin family protein [Echinicola sp. 20G]
MKNIIIIVLVFGFIGSHSYNFAQTQGYQIGDEAMDFELPNVSGDQVSLSGLENAKGAIVIFTCNTCPYAKAYEDRIIELHEEYAPRGYPVVAINSNDDQISPGDSFEAMKVRASEKDFPFDYAYDKDQTVIKAYGGMRTPHVYLLNKEENKFVVSYIGAIDNNYQDPNSVSEAYVENAVEALLQNKNIETKTTKAIGCGIKWIKETD